MVYQLDAVDIWFPKPELADEDGLLAIGGDLSPERLILAYHNSIFPWFSDDSPILWYSPQERFVLFPEKLKISSSLKQVLRKGIFTVTKNQEFNRVIKACADVKRKGEPGTWITPGMINAYGKLHELGFAHSLEVWKDQKLAGGLYGVELNGVFCGESMFSLESNASKVAIVNLCSDKNLRMIDCQMHTPHLESMGSEFISRSKYLHILQSA